MDIPDYLKPQIDEIDKKIEDYSTSEMVAFAAYIARNIIEEYATLDDMVENVLNFTKGSKIQ